MDPLEEEAPRRDEAGGAGLRSECVYSEAWPTAQAVPGALLQEVSSFIYHGAPHPNWDIALSGAITFLAGIVGREYNVNGSGLNVYWLCLAPTGMGKEASATGHARLFSAITEGDPNRRAATFQGPGAIASAPALQKHLAANPCFASVIGEGSLKLAALSDPKASPNDKALKAALLDVFGKSGDGQLLAPMIYSDREKNVAAIQSPALTLLCEGTPETFYQSVTEAHIADGFISRFNITEVEGKRGYLNPSIQTKPKPELVTRLKDLIAHVLSLRNLGQVQNVGMTAEAERLFIQYEHWNTDQINAADREVIRQLRNRDYLKALKLAAIHAVGVNYLQPTITVSEAQWATHLVSTQTNKVLARFAQGDVGDEAGNEAKQEQAVRRVIKDFYKSDSDKLKQYGFGPEFRQHGFVPVSYIQRRLVSLPAFKGDKVGATKAIKRAIDNLIEAGELARVNPADVLKYIATSAKVVVPLNPAAFVK